MTWPVNNCALLTWEFPKEKLKHSYDKKLQSFAHFIRGKPRWNRCAFLWFDHADVEKHTSTNEDEHTVNRGHFICGLSLMEKLCDTWLCEVIETSVKYEMVMRHHVHSNFLSEYNRVEHDFSNFLSWVDLS